jgi:undecaprenyl-diphosphatase
MGDPAVHDFWPRRLARDDSLGLPLTAGVLLSVLLFAAFCMLSLEMRGSQPPGVDQFVYDGLRAHRESSPVIRSMFVGITQLGDEPFLSVLTLAVAAMLVYRRRWGLALAFVLIVLCGAMFDSWAKNLFGRIRPMLHDAAIHETSYSFPSGHSMESMVAYGALAYLLILALPPRRKVRLAAVAALSLLIVAIGFSRMYLAAHWFTDVIGGFTLGAAWLALCITVLECTRRRRAERQKSSL